MTSQLLTDSLSADLGDPFEGWAADLVHEGELTKISARKYEALWRAWRAWLVLHQTRWNEVSGELIEAFLQGAAPGQGGRRRAIHAERMSSYTRQRYWRLLRGVYATAVRDGLLSKSPVLGVREAQRPMISSRDRVSQVLEPALFAALQSPETIEAIIPVRSPAHWWHRRDRAILALLVETGITTSELIALRGADLRRGDRGPVDLKTWGEGADCLKTLQVQILDSEESLGRVLLVCARSSALLVAWLHARHALLLARAQRGHTPDERQALLASSAQEGPLFMARRARLGVCDMPAMEPVTLYYGVSQALKRLRDSISPPSVAPTPSLIPDAPYVARGPGVIRNSVLRHWLSTVGVAETVHRAGLRSANSLRLSANEKNDPFLSRKICVVDSSEEGSCRAGDCARNRNAICDHRSR